MHVIAAKAVAFKEALSKEFQEYQLCIVQNAKALAEALLSNDLELISGGTDNHLMLIDLQSDLHEDDHFPLALQFEQSGQVIVDVLVAQP